MCAETRNGIVDAYVGVGPQQHVKVKPIYRSGTHIVCTLGPSSRSVEHITNLLERGEKNLHPDLGPDTVHWHVDARALPPQRRCIAKTHITNPNHNTHG